MWKKVINLSYFLFSMCVLVFYDNLCQYLILQYGIGLEANTHCKSLYPICIHEFHHNTYITGKTYIPEKLLWFNSSTMLILGLLCSFLRLSENTNNSIIYNGIRKFKRLKDNSNILIERFTCSTKLMNVDLTQF